MVSKFSHTVIAPLPQISTNHGNIPAPSRTISSQPLDTIDQRYLNSTHDPIVNPLKKLMKIELYNNKWLRMLTSQRLTHSTIVNNPSSELDILVFLPHKNSYPKYCVIQGNEYNSNKS